MNEALIGQEIVLRGQADERLRRLVSRATTAFLESAGGEPADRKAFKREMRAAFAPLEAASGPAMARLLVLAEGIQVTVKLESDLGDGMTVLCRV